jgi:hypothetical protein
MRRIGPIRVAVRERPLLAPSGRAGVDVLRTERTTGLRRLKWRRKRAYRRRKGGRGDSRAGVQCPDRIADCPFGIRANARVRPQNDLGKSS